MGTEPHVQAICPFHEYASSPSCCPSQSCRLHQQTANY